MIKQKGWCKIISNLPTVNVEQCITRTKKTEIFYVYFIWIVTGHNLEHFIHFKRTEPTHEIRFGQNDECVCKSLIGSKLQIEKGVFKIHSRVVTMPKLTIQITIIFIEWNEKKNDENKQEDILWSGSTWYTMYEHVSHKYQKYCWVTWIVIFERRRKHSMILSTLNGSK